MPDTSLIPTADQTPIQILDLIRNLRGRQERLEKRRQQAIDMLVTSIARVMDQLDQAEIIPALSELYWYDEEMAFKVGQIYKLHTGNKFTPSPVAIEYQCQYCKYPLKQTCTSWVKFKQLSNPEHRWTNCIPCRRRQYAIEKANEEERQRLRDAEYKERQRQENKEYQRREHELRTMPYAEYLKTEHWQQLRKHMYRRAGYRCQLCNDQGRLNVHHRTYERKGCEYYSDLIVLCEACHEKFHDVAKEDE